MMTDRLLLIGDGFIGGRLKKLLERTYGWEVTVVDLKYGFDIRDRDEVDKVISGYKGEKVLLMAAIANLNDFEKNPALGTDVNVNGVSNVALACSKHEKVLYYISTCCVYGNTPDLPSTEEARTMPSEIYAACKLAGEWIIKGFNKSYDMKYVILRIATCYGPGMRAALAPAVFINQVMRGEPITIHGDGTQTRTLTYIDDEIEGIAAVLRSNAVNDTFNISTEEEISVNEMAHIIKEEIGATDHKIVYVEDRKGQTFTEQIDTGKMRDVRLWKGRYAPDPHKVNGEIGWKAKISFREGIKRTLDWMNEKGYKQIL